MRLDAIVRVAGIMGIICVFLLLFFRILGRLILWMNFGRRIPKKPYQEDYRCFSERQVDMSTGSFLSHKYRLCSYLFQKQSAEGKKLVVLAKGHGCFSVDYKEMIIQLAERGYDVFTYDVTGTGSSEGMAPGGYQQWIMDLEAALEEVASKYRGIYLLGHSLGGFAAAAVLGITQVPIRAVTVASPINSGTEYAKYLHECIPCIFTKQVGIVMRNYEKKKFGRYADYTGVSGINGTNIPILVIHGAADKEVPLKCSIAAYENQITNKNARVICLCGGQHELLNYDNVREKIMDFFQNHE